MQREIEEKNKDLADRFSQIYEKNIGSKVFYNFIIKPYKSYSGIIIYILFCGAVVFYQFWFLVLFFHFLNTILCIHKVKVELFLRVFL